MEIALCYPYGMPDIDRLITDTGGFWHADTIGVSQAARPLVRLSNSYGEVPGSRPGCYFIARQHSGETSGSWVLDGLLRQLASYGSDAPIIWAVPFANIDGVEQGDYGKDNFPYDLNRAWDASNPMRHEVMVIQRDMYRWKARCQPLIALDFHAPGACETTGVYCYLPRGEMDRNFAVAINGWAERLKLAIGDMAAADFARIGNYPSRWETPHFNNFCTAKLGMHSLSLETPYCRINEIVLQREHYQRIGANIADSLVGKIKEE